MNKKLYVLGFAFNQSKTIGIFIEKKRPAWQAGLINGIGGKIELNECAIDAMVREFQEETNTMTTKENWQHVITMYGPHKHDPDNWIVYVFTTILTDDQIQNCYPTTDEMLVASSMLDLFKYYNPQHNLHWLIPLAIDTLNDNVDYKLIKNL